MRIRHLLLDAPALRALLEALLIGVLLWLSLLLFHRYLSPIILQLIYSLLIGPVCMLLYVLRLRLPANFLHRESILDAAIAFIFSLVLSCAELAFILLLQRSGTLIPYWRDGYRIFLWAIIPLVLGFSTFVFFRGVLRSLLFWNRLRRKQLLRSLTHAHVMLVALGAGLLILLVEALLLRTSRNFSLILPATLGLVVISVIALLAVVPVSALFSYLVIRRTTNRIQALAAATSALRNGNYAVRVPVAGEDEVAQLQADFNAMATSLERAMRDLQQERDRVAGLLQARRELVAGVSHELRTPVATLRSYLETSIMHWNGNPPPTLRRDLQVMEDEVISLQALIEDLFALSRAEVGRLTLRCEPNNVGELIHRIVKARAPLAWQANRIEVVAEVPSELPLALVDANRLEQALQNLLHNAVRHTSPGGIVAVAVAAELEALVLRVKDTGEGIAPQDLPRIWERFYQAKNAGNGIGTGTGLGLALVKEWIEAMGGSVAAESVLGEGSCFTIRLPQAPVTNLMQQINL